MKDAADIAGTIVTMVATIVAGAWAYYQFVRGRVFKARITLKLNGELLRRSDGLYVVSTVEMINVGLTRVDIQRSGTGLSVFACEPLDDVGSNARNLPRLLLAGFDLFRSHDRAEPGVALQEQRIFALPPRPMVAITLECRVVAHGSSFTATSVVKVPNISTTHEEGTECPSNN